MRNDFGGGSLWRSGSGMYFGGAWMRNESSLQGGFAETFCKLL